MLEPVDRHSIAQHSFKAVLSSVAHVESASCYQQNYQSSSCRNITPLSTFVAFRSTSHHPFIAFADIISCCKPTQPLISASLSLVRLFSAITTVSPSCQRSTSLAKFAADTDADLYRQFPFDC